MAGWAGFSDEEVTRMKQLKDPLISEKAEKLGRTPSTNKSRQQLQRERALNQHSHRTNGQNEVPFILPEQQLSKTKMNLPKATELPASELGPKPNVEEANKQLSTTEESCKKETDNPGAKASCIFQDSTIKELSTVQIKGMELLVSLELTIGNGASLFMQPSWQWRERSRLEQLQLEQRVMEEKNKRKKALLSKAIAERSKRTMAETVKLKHIQKELQCLDDLLANGVNVLRNRIEQSSWEYLLAKKRYDKAEVEYVAAKMDLHKKIDQKEQLTEHLCAIIQQNELRKSKKLEELMQQLEMETDEEQLELEIEVESMLQRQEQAKATDQTNAGTDKSSQQSIQQGDSKNQSLEQIETETESAVTCETDRKNSKDKLKELNLNCRIPEKIETLIAIA
ncbi:RAB6-interacting golgin isoform X1 [Leucoraja erinacea]|uniref:RAB6-interacting golgin isoform X1 n=1 Tax=Leucoraja erinaceus TaxID=7782 RepID=UPI002456B3F1|nr:RAB6-interacting golgin isoform X1 [Leucoraja erinacea]